MQKHIIVWTLEKSYKLRLTKGMYWCICELATSERKLVEAISTLTFCQLQKSKMKLNFLPTLLPCNVVLLLQLDNKHPNFKWREYLRGDGCRLFCSQKLAHSRTVSQQFCRQFELQVLSDRRGWRDAQVHKDCNLLQHTVNTACSSLLCPCHLNISQELEDTVFWQKNSYLRTGSDDDLFRSRT